MKILTNFCSLIIFLSVFLNSCGQDYNSHSADASFRNDSNLLSNCNDEKLSQADKSFCFSFNILKDNCFSCHPNWSAFNTEQKWQQSGLVVAGNVLNSGVINRLINAGSDMPLGGNALSQEEYERLQNWVENIK